MSKHCPRCKGPKDILHTDTECQVMQRAADVPDFDRYHLSVVAAIIGRSASSMEAAYRLYTDGFLKAPAPNRKARL